MAIAGKVLTVTSAAPAALFFIAPGVPVPDNCISIALLNVGTTPLLFALSEVIGAAAVEGTNCVRLLAGSAYVLPCGPFANRGFLDDGQLAGSGLVFAAPAAATVHVTYLNALNTPG